MSDKIKNSIDFVARHYDPAAFTDRQGRWSTMATQPRRRFFRPLVAAAIAAIVVGASAATFYFISRPAHTPAAPVSAPAPVDSVDTPDTIDLRHASLKLSFTDAPVPEVCRAIEQNYGVTLADIPVDSERLTLDYEGTADDLVGTINALIGSHIRIE